jgi:L-fucose isomerase-like protein
MINATTPVIAIGRPTFDLDHGSTLVEAAWDRLDDAGFDPVGPRAITTELESLDRLLDGFVQDDGADASCVVVLQATFADSSLVARIDERLGLPIVIWSFPEPRTGGRLRLNSLCGANLAAYLLRRRRSAVAFVHADPTTTESAAALVEARERAVSAPAEPERWATLLPVAASVGNDHAERIAGARLGVVGDAPVGFEPCMGDDHALRRITGLGVDRVPLTALFERADDATADDRAVTAARVRAATEVPVDVAAAGMDESIRLHEGLRALADRHGWAAVATRCWPECMTEYGGAMCTPMAMMTEDGVPGVCEADLYGAATALMLRTVAGTDPFIADLVDVDRSDDTSAVWHCGVAPITLADPTARPVAITHPNRHRALANQFALRPGRVTVARLSQARNETSLVIGGAEMLARPRPFVGTCGVLRWDGGVDRALEVVFGRGLEHHVGIVYGEWRDELRSLAAAWGVPVVSLDAANA